MIIPIVLTSIVAILIFVYTVGRYNEEYWKKRGVKFHGRNNVIGPFWDLLKTNRAMFQIFGELYEKYRNEPAVGIAEMFKPALFIIDPKNMHHVLHGDFHSFNHRGIESVPGDQLSDNILFMNGSRWKLMRKNMSPLFTANKLKSMFYIMDKNAQDFVTFLKNNPETREGDFFNTVSTFCSASVCGSIFGIGSESVFDSPFLKMAKSVSTSTFKNNMKFAILSIMPKLSNFLGLKFFTEHEDYFISAITKVTKIREVEKIKKHDFGELCSILRKNGTMKDETTGCEMEPTYGLLSAQAWFFFIAGVEPCANAIFSTFILLCRHPDILEKVHQEIDEHFEKHNGNLTYEVILEMQYVDKVLSEAMRFFPPVGYVTRQCIRDSVLPVGDIKVEKGTKIYSPIYQIHHDPQFYPEPEVFDPERFSKERKPGDDIYMPFGMGNRMCIGARYSKLQIIAGIAHVLRNFTIKLKDENAEIKFVVDAFNVRPTNIDVVLVPRNVK